MAPSGRLSTPGRGLNSNSSPGYAGAPAAATQLPAGARPAGVPAEWVGAVSRVGAGWKVSFRTCSQAPLSPARPGPNGRPGPKRRAGSGSADSSCLGRRSKLCHNISFKQSFYMNLSPYIRNIPESSYHFLLPEASD